MLLAAAALVVGSVVAVSSFLGSSGPEDMVASYLKAVAAGDAPGALAYGDLPDGPHAWLSSDVLQDQHRAAPMSDVSVIASQISGNIGRVNVQYTLAFASGSRSVEDTIPVTHEGGRWRLARVAVPVSVDVATAADHVRFAGVAVPSGPMLLFPGALPVSFDVPALTADPNGEVVRFAGRSQLTVRAEVSAQARQTISEAVAAALSACLAGTSNVQALCPTPSDGRAVPGSLRGSAVGNVSSGVEVTVAEGASGLIDVSGSVQVSGRYQQLDFDNLATTKTGTQKVTFAGYCQPGTPDKIVWSVG